MTWQWIGATISLALMAVVLIVYKVREHRDNAPSADSTEDKPNDG